METASKKQEDVTQSQQLANEQSQEQLQSGEKAGKEGKGEKHSAKGGTAQRKSVGKEMTDDLKKGGKGKKGLAKGGKGKATESKGAKGSKAEVDTGKEVAKDSQKDQEAAESYSQSKGKKDEKKSKRGVFGSMAEKFVTGMLAKQGKKLVDKGKEKLSEKANDLVGHAAESVGGKAGKLIDKYGKKAVGKGADALEKKADKLVDKGAEKAGDKAGELVDKAVDKIKGKKEKGEDTSEAEEKAAQADAKAESAAKEEKGGKGEKSAKGGKGEKSEKGGKGERSAKGGEGEKSEKGGKGEKSAKGGKGGGKGGEVSMPKLGGGAPKVSAKGAGSGGNSVESFANSGLSYQVQNYGSLGGKADADLSKTHTEMNASIPGEKNAQVNDGKADASSRQSRAEVKTANAEAVKNTEFDETTPTTEAVMDVSAQKSQVQSSGSEDLPVKPAVEADSSNVESTKGTLNDKFASAKSSATTAVNAVDKTITARGFDDLHKPKAELEEDADKMKTAELSSAGEIAGLSDEAQGVLDQTEFAKNSSSKMEGIKAQVKQAEETRKAETSARISEHEQSISAEIENANNQEKTLIEQKKAEMNSQIAAESASYESQLASCNEEQQSEIGAAEAELDSERSKAQASVDEEYEKGKSEKAKAEKEAEEKKNDGGFLKRAANWIKSKVKSIANWLKEKVSGIIDKVKSQICKVLDGFVAIVSRINKDLGAKLKKAVDKFKSILDKLAEALKNVVNSIIDAAADAVNALVDKVVAKIEQLVESLKAGLKAIWNTLKSAWKAAVEGFKALLSALGDFMLLILKKAMELAGIDPSVFANAMAVAKDIVKNPGQFFSTLGKGFVQGFKQFGANIKENIKAVFKNLFNMWLGTAGLSLPGDFSVKSLIKFGLQVVGIDVDGILAKIGIKGGLDSINSLKDVKDGIKESIMSNPIVEFVQDVRQNGLSAIVKYIGEYLKSLAKDIMQEAIKTIAQKAATAALTKLAALATPVSGLIAALKAVWDLIQFVRQNMSAIQGLVSALTTTLGAAAKGDPSAVANGVEAALCRLIPLAIDLLLRLAGIDVGGAIQKIVGKIREKVGGAISKLVGKFQGAKDSLMKKLKATKAGQAYTKGKEKVTSVKNAYDAKVAGVKNAVVGKAGELADKGIAKIDSKVDPMISKGMESFNNSKAGQNLSKVNSGAQKFADRVNGFTNSASSATSGVVSGMKKATDTLNDFNSHSKEGDAFGLKSEQFLPNNQSSKTEKTEVKSEKSEEQKPESKKEEKKPETKKEEKPEEKKGEKAEEKKPESKEEESEDKGVKQKAPESEAKEETPKAEKKEDSEADKKEKAEADKQKRRKELEEKVAAAKKEMDENEAIFNASKDAWLKQTADLQAKFQDPTLVQLHNLNLLNKSMNSDKDVIDPIETSADLAKYFKDKMDEHLDKYMESQDNYDLLKYQLDRLEA